MSKKDNIEEAKNIANKTLTSLDEQKLSPIPRHYTVFYSALSDDYPDLGAQIKKLIADGGVTAEDIIDLYEAYFGIDRESRAIWSAGDSIETLIANLRQEVRTAGREATDYGKVLEEFADKIDSGGVGNLPQAINLILSETKKMQQRNTRLEEQFARSSEEMAELRQSLDKMRLAANTDSLTGIANRKHFDVRIKELLEEGAVNGEPLAILMADIDHFKRFNDNYGHQVGDHVLRLVAAAICKCIRGQDFVARYGGEEFVIILPQTGVIGAVAVAENIRSTLSSKKLTRKATGESLGKITLSFGAAQYKNDESADALIQRADEGLYCAKRAGRNRIETIEAMGGQLLRISDIAG